jgi:hypothetical protein
VSDDNRMRCGNYGAHRYACCTQTVEWNQTVTIPKRAALPKDISLDILGIQIGDTHGEAKAKLAKPFAQTQPPPPKQGAPVALPQLSFEVAV